MRLPRSSLKTRWVRVKEFPKKKRFGKFSLILEQITTYEGEPHSILVAYVRDHPFLRKTLVHMPHVPRSVRSIYRADVRLAFNRAKEVWHILKALDKADADWNAYLFNMTEADWQTYLSNKQQAEKAGSV